MASKGVVKHDGKVGVLWCFQVQKIRLLLRERGLGAVRVGTVDDYQGQEERFVFISTVRPSYATLILQECFHSYLLHLHPLPAETSIREN